jgi:two-component system, OmpR family, heavy metal sensor histidine kinase CusS
LNISFRTRLFFIATLIVGVVLTLVLALGWSSVMKAEVDKLNDKLCIEAKRLATQPFDANELPRLEADVALKLRLGAVDQVMLRFDALEGGGNFQSQAWLSAPRINELTWAAARFEAEPGPRDAGRPPPPPNEHRDGEREPPERNPRGTCSLASFTHNAHD